jgi:small subunit ribosomal protein S2
MANVSMKSLLESGVHFGHRTHKWNPRMKPYIFTERNNIHIIDLQKTVKAIDEAYKQIVDTVAEGGTVLFVGTKRQAQETIQTEATRCGMPYVTARWLGGMLTNWRTIRQRVNELERLERMRDRGDFQRLTKKEGMLLTRKIERLEMLLGGIRDMAGLPDLLFAVDVRREETAIHEANLLEIPVIAMVDTNCDPYSIDYVIPSNDDAIRAIKLIVGKMADAVQEGRALRKEDTEAEMAARQARVEMLTEEKELSDEDLLGEATLRKLSAMAQSEEEEEELETEGDEDEEEVVEVEVDVIEDEDEEDEDEEDEDEEDEDDDEEDDDNEYDDYEGEDEDSEADDEDDDVDEDYEDED